MIKHFCDICGKEISGISRVSDVTLLCNIVESQFTTLPDHETGCEICVSCAKTIIDTVSAMKRGRGVIYVEKK